MWGQPALLGDSQLTRPGAGSCSQLSTGGPPPNLGSQLPHLLGGEEGGAQRADLLCLRRLGLRPRRGIGAMTRINALGSGLGHEDLLSTCGHKTSGRCSEALGHTQTQRCRHLLSSCLQSSCEQRWFPRTSDKEQGGALCHEEPERSCTQVTQPERNRPHLQIR